MKNVYLYKNKGVAIVDDADFEEISKYKWHLDRGYAAMTVKGDILYMHRFINKTPKGMSTDHINGNKLDNQRKNLRTCTQSQNNANTILRKDNSSGYRGVVWHKKDKRWQVQIIVNGKMHYLGQYKKLEQAVKVQQENFKKKFGEFAGGTS